MKELYRQWIGVCFLGIVHPLYAQQRSLDTRLDSTTAAIVTRLADSARAAGLPAEPLLDKALEGASKHADSNRIVEAVRGLAQRLGQASAVLGSTATESDLVAAAGALYQGVPAAEVARLRTLRAGQPVALPLVVLADLIQRGVPVPTAISVVRDMARRGVGDATFAVLRREVEHDIAAGAPPAIAALTRARGAIYALPNQPSGTHSAATAASDGGGVPSSTKPAPKP